MTDRVARVGHPLSVINPFTLSPSYKRAHLCVTFSRLSEPDILLGHRHGPSGPSAGGLLPCASVSLFVKNVSNPSLVKQGCFRAVVSLGASRDLTVSE